MTELEVRLTAAFSSWAGGMPPLQRVQEFIKELAPVGLDISVVPATPLEEEPVDEDPAETDD